MPNPWPVTFARQQLAAYVRGVQGEDWLARKRATDRAVSTLAHAPPYLNRTTPLDYWRTGALVPDYHVQSRYSYFATMKAFYDNDFGAIELWEAPFSLTLPIIRNSVNALVDFYGGAELEAEGDVTDEELRQVKRTLRKHLRHLGWGGNGSLTAGLDDMEQPFVMARSPLTEFTATDGVAFVDIDDRPRPPDWTAQVTLMPFEGTGSAAVYEFAGQTLGKVTELLGTFDVTREQPLYFPQALDEGRWRWGSSPISAMISPLRQLFNRYSRFNDIFDQFGSPILVIDTGENVSTDPGNIAGLDDAELQERLEEQRADTERILEEEQHIYEGQGRPHLLQYDPQAQALIPVIQDLKRIVEDANPIAAAFFGEGNGEALRNGQTVNIQTERTKRAMRYLRDEVAATLSEAYTAANALAGRGPVTFTLKDEEEGMNPAEMMAQGMMGNGDGEEDTNGEDDAPAQFGR